MVSIPCFRRIHLQNASRHGNPSRTYQKSCRPIRQWRPKINNSPSTVIRVTAPQFRRIHLQNASGHGNLSVSKVRQAHPEKNSNQQPSTYPHHINSPLSPPHVSSERLRTWKTLSTCQKSDKPNHRLRPRPSNHPSTSIIKTAPNPTAYIYRMPPDMENPLYVRTRSPAGPSVG